MQTFAAREGSPLHYAAPPSMAFKTLSRCWLALVCAAAVSLPARAVPIIDNGPGNGSAGTFGPAGAQTFGSVFRVSGPETVLQQFSFSLQRTSLAPFTVQAFVATFNGLFNSGAVLFTSSQFNIVDDTMFQTYTINTGGLALVNNATYVAYFSSLTPVQAAGGAEWETAATPFTPTNRLIFNTATTPSALPSTPWSNANTSVFNAVFSVPVPEIHATTARLPLTMSFLLLSVLGGARRRAASSSSRS